MSLLGISPGSKTHNLSSTSHVPLLPHSIHQILGEEGGLFSSVTQRDTYTDCFLPVGFSRLLFYDF